MAIYKDIMDTIHQADALLIGASNGFSISEGLHIFAENQAFEHLLGDFKKTYGIRSILQGFFFPFPTEEEKWAFFSRVANHYSGSYTGSPNTDALKEIIGDKPYFIVTSNGENHFELAGFRADCIYEIEGSWKQMQCSTPCHTELYPAFELLKTMAQSEQNCRIPSALIPKCPECGRPMQLHVATDHSFLPDHTAKARFRQFLNTWHHKKLVILELGIGMRNQMIKGPLMRLAAQEPYAAYITLNKGEVYIPAAISDKSYSLDGDITTLLSELVEAGK